MNKIVLKKFESEQSTCCVHFKNTRRMAFSNMRIVAGTVVSAVGDMVVNNDDYRTRPGARNPLIGNNMTVMEDDASVIGHECNVAGARCKVVGNRSCVSGNRCTVTGSWCIVSGDECTVTGDGSHVKGNRCTITGNGCTVIGNNCVIRGSHASITGQGNVVHDSPYTDPARSHPRPPSAGRRDAPDLFFALGGVTVVNTPEHAPVRQEAPVRATAFDTSQPDVELSDEDAERTPDRACTVCMSNSRAVVAIPCLHSTLCHTCCGGLKDGGAKDPVTGLHLCPQCRCGVERFGHIYS